MDTLAVRFKEDAIRERLDEVGADTVVRVHIQKRVDKGTDDLDPYILCDMCRDLQCLPTDIAEFV